MKMPWISLAGLMEEDSTVLDNLVLPTAADYADISDIIVDNPFVPNKSDFINYLLIETVELPLLYTDPSFLKIMVGYWSKAKMPEWVQMYRTLLYKYNPLWNKDGTIKERRDIAFNKTGSTTNTGTVGLSGSSSGSAEHQVTGYDTNVYSPDKKDLTANSASQTTTNNLAGTSAEGGTSADLFERTEQGNIGLTTTMQLIREQRELAQFNFYDYLMQAFKREFCIMLW